MGRASKGGMSPLVAWIEARTFLDKLTELSYEETGVSRTRLDFLEIRVHWYLEVGFEKKICNVIQSPLA